MTTKDTYIIYVKARTDGTLLAARYEVHDGETYSIIEGMEMSRPWLVYSHLEDGLRRLTECALTATLNAPEETALQLLGGDF